MLLLYAASGLGVGMRISLLAAIPAADLFSGPHLGVILGAGHGGGGIGGFIGPFLGGFIFDATGSYQIAFAAAALAIAASAAATWIAAPRRVCAAKRATNHDRCRGGRPGGARLEDRLSRDAPAHRGRHLLR